MKVQKCGYLDDEFDADFCRGGHDFGRVREENYELGNDRLSKMSKPTAQYGGQVADSDASLTRYLRAKVFQLGGKERGGRERESEVNYDQESIVSDSLIIPWHSLCLVELLKSGRVQ